MSTVRCWFFLFASILFEVTGTGVMRFSQGSSWAPLGMALMYCLLALSYFCLAKAITRVPVGVAYAFWEGIGLLLITLFSFFILSERLDANRIIALTMILGGTLLVHHGTDASSRKVKTSEGRELSRSERGGMARQGGV